MYSDFPFLRGAFSSSRMSWRRAGSSLSCISFHPWLSKLPLPLSYQDIYGHLMQRPQVIVDIAVDGDDLIRSCFTF